MGALPTVKIKRVGDKFIVINQSDFNPAKHELYIESNIEKIIEVEDIKIVGPEIITEEVEVEDEAYMPDEVEQEDETAKEVEISSEDDISYSVTAEVDKEIDYVSMVTTESSRQEIEDYGRKHGIELDKRKSTANMIADLHKAIEEKE